MAACGEKETEMKETKCKTCFYTDTAEFLFCPKCGNRVVEDSKDKKERDDKQDGLYAIRFWNKRRDSRTIRLDELERRLAKDNLT